MERYQVTWKIDIEADTPFDAAQEALRIQRNPQSIATVFTVADGSGDNSREVDLSEDQGVFFAGAQSLPLPDIELVAAKVHETWIETKLSQGIKSRPSADGREQMVPYDQLDEDLKELDRATVRAVYAAIAAAS